MLLLVAGWLAAPLPVLAEGVLSAPEALAQGLLAQNGFTSVYSISEGMNGSGFGLGWLARGLPVEPCQGC